MASPVLTLLEATGTRDRRERRLYYPRGACDKRMETCGAKFANIANFRGFPHIPGQDAVLALCHQRMAATKGPVL